MGNARFARLGVPAFSPNSGLKGCRRAVEHVLRHRLAWMWAQGVVVACGSFITLARSLCDG